jgi:hypothetical protein
MTNSNDDTTFEEEGWPTEIKIKRECTPDDPCGRLTCELCSTPYRLRWIRQTLAITKAHPGQHEIATIVIAVHPYMFGAEKIRGILRGVLERADFEGALLRGGIDVIWDSALGSPVLCAHVLAIDVPPNAWTRLRWLTRNAKLIEWGFKPSFLLKVQRLRDPEKQIANLVKFHLYFWPRSPTGAARGDTLPADRLEWLADWASDLTFKDFAFEFGKATARKDPPWLRDLSGRQVKDVGR